MTAPFIGEVRPFAFNFAPRNYMLASGQLLPIAQYTALFSILGTTYGGNGTTNFALPNLNGCMAMGNGSGPGLTPRVLGEVLGEETVTLLSTNMPAHSHAPYARAQPGTANSHNAPQAGDYLTRFNTSSSAIGRMYNTPPLENATTMATNMISFVGANQSHNNLQPILVINYCVAIQGIFPTRN
ncbi:MAG: microcystin-dependent protein [Sphingomonas bacterium]|uniref:phage tail protein n=1 Tax=Sphingomonas bacterium TaxID=1895847 RepID=UPI00261B7522|nr:tail fiber protein [Sphingomonas bacterium]MDB5712190.1 microcystin-dependent protein [Sphingomonas bacterium]